MISLCAVRDRLVFFSVLEAINNVKNPPGNCYYEVKATICYPKNTFYYK